MRPCRPTCAGIYGHLGAESRRLDRLLSDLLDVDRLRHGVARTAFAVTDVGELVQEVVAAMRAGGQVDDRLIEVEAESATAEVDAAKVERIVENLLRNAVRHTPEGSPIRCGSSVEEVC